MMALWIANSHRRVDVTADSFGLFFHDSFSIITTITIQWVALLSLTCDIYTPNVSVCVCSFWKRRKNNTEREHIMSLHIAQIVNDFVVVIFLSVGYYLCKVAAFIEFRAWVNLCVYYAQNQPYHICRNMLSG